MLHKPTVVLGILITILLGLLVSLFFLENSTTQAVPKLCPIVNSLECARIKQTASVEYEEARRKSTRGPTSTIDPYYTYKPTKLLPEPDWAREIVEMRPGEYGLGYVPFKMARYSTSFWRNGAVPADDYTDWYGFYVLSGPYGIDNQHSIRTLLFGGPAAIRDKYEKLWTPPIDLGEITIIACNGPDKPFSFKSASGKSGTLDLANGKWSFDN